MFGNLKDRRLRSKWQLDLALHQAFQVASNNVQALQRLVLHVQQHTEMLRTLPVSGYAASVPARTFVDGLLSLSAHHRSWCRDLETWERVNGSPWSQFTSLAQHLLAKRPMPTFMTSAWFEGRSPAARRHQKWFKHLGLGYGIRGVETPIRLTPLMGRYFAQAPDHCSVKQAVRWSQVRGLGGDTALADAIVATRLGQTFNHNEYWLLVIRFLIDNPDFGINNVGAVVEYLHFNRRLARLKPCCKRSKLRAADEFLCEVRRWRARPSVLKKAASLTWKSSGIRGLNHQDQRRLWVSSSWKIRELLDSNELMEEGRNMRHCVGRYGHKSACGATTIWSLTCSDAQSQCRRELTIEVNPRDRRIVQAKGPGNSTPSAEARRVMLLWAKEQGLGVAAWI